MFTKMRGELLYVKKGLLMLSLLLGLLLFTQQRADAAITQDKELYTLTTNKACDAIGLRAAIHMDRQVLGVYMAKGSTIQIRIQNAAAFNDSLTFRFQGNDEKYGEAKLTVPENGDWLTYTAVADGVPFIMTPLNSSVKPVIHYEMVNGGKELVYYKDGVDSQDAFFQKWDACKDSFAVMENDAVTLLVPIGDRYHIVNNLEVRNPAYRFTSISDVFRYYTAFRTQFDRYVGLTSSDPNSVDYNPGGKFFLRANKSGAGYAYTIVSEIGINMPTLQANDSGFLCKDWVSLHEVSHNYEPGSVGSGVQICDVGNNVLSYFFQQTYLTSGDDGWMGKLTDVEAEAADARAKVTHFNDYAAVLGRHQIALYMFVNVLNKIGPEKGSAAAYRYARQYRQDTGKPIESSDGYVFGYYEASGYNVIPYLESYHMPVSQRGRTEIFQKDGTIVYSIRELVDTDAKARSISSRLGQEGLYSLAAPDDLAYTGYTSNVTMKLNIDDVNALKGKSILIKNGSKVAKSVAVTGTTLNFTIPIGAYEIELPQPVTGIYERDFDYLIAKSGSVTKQITYTKADRTLLASDLAVSFTGLGDGEFATLNYDNNSLKLRLVTLEGEPHCYFTSVYASIRVTDASGNQVFKHDYIGNVKNKAGEETIPVKEGYHIWFQHLEPTRLNFNSVAQGKELDDLSVTSKNAEDYIVTKYGIDKVSWSEAQDKAQYLSLLDSYIALLRAKLTTEQIKEPSLYYKEKTILKSALIPLDDAAKAKYEESLADFFTAEKVVDPEPDPQPNPDPDPQPNPDPDPQPTVVPTELRFMGLGDDVFARGIYDPNTGRLTMTTYAKDPHVYFKTTYARITVKDASGNTKLDKNYVGNVRSTAEVKTISLGKGDVISIYYQERTRLGFYDTTTGARDDSLTPPQNAKVTDYTVEAGRLVRGATYSNPEIKTEIRMLGLGDVQFAKCVYNSLDKNVTLTTIATEPHVYFKESYAMVTIRDSKGNVKLTKDYAGNVKPAAETKQVSVSVGDTISIYYIERTRLRFFDQLTGSQLTTMTPEKDRVVTDYTVTENGLVRGKYYDKTVGDNTADKDFHFKANGLGDWTFAQLTYAGSTGKLTLKTEAGEPHVYFKSAYLWVLVRNSKGAVKINHMYTGTYKQNAKTETVDFEAGDTILIYHQEPSRLLGYRGSSTTVDASLQAKAQMTTYTMTKNGLVKGR